jgi:hypothetical protein
LAGLQYVGRGERAAIIVAQTKDDWNRRIVPHLNTEALIVGSAASQHEYANHYCQANGYLESPHGWFISLLHQ